MAFPVIQTADTKNGTVTTGGGSSTWTLTYPTNGVAGDLFLAFFAIRGNTITATLPTGWVTTGTTLTDGTTTLVVAKKLVLGTETGTFSVTLSGSQQGAWRIYRINGWGRDLGTAFNNTASSLDVVVSTSSNATTINPNPPILDPNNWTNEDALYIAASTTSGAGSFTAFPSTYTTTSSDATATSTGAALGLASKNITATSEDPGTFTTSASSASVAVTVAVASIGKVTVSVDNAASTSSASAFASNVGNKLPESSMASSFSATVPIPTIKFIFGNSGVAGSTALEFATTSSATALEPVKPVSLSPETANSASATSLAPNFSLLFYPSLANANNASASVPAQSLIFPLGSVPTSNTSSANFYTPVQSLFISVGNAASATGVAYAVPAQVYISWVAFVTPEATTLSILPPIASANGSALSPILLKQYVQTLSSIPDPSIWAISFSTQSQRFKTLVSDTINTFSTLVKTQSKKFRTLVSDSVTEFTATFSTQSQRFKTLVSDVANTLTLLTQSQKFRTFTSQINFDPNLTKINQFSRALVTTFSAGVNTVIFTARYVSLVVLNALSTSIIYLTNKLLESSSLLASTFIQKTNKFINSTSTLVPLLFNQSSRFVNLAALPSFIASKSALSIAKIVALSETLLVNTRKTVSVSLNTAVQQIAALSKLTYRFVSLALSSTLTAVRQSRITHALSALVTENIALLTLSKFYRSLAASYSNAVNFVILSSRYISLSITTLFNSALIRLPNKLLQSAFSNLINIQRSIGKIVATTNTFVTSLFTQSSRFVSVAVISSFAAGLSKIVGKTLLAANNITVAVQKAVAVIVQATTYLDAELIVLGSREILLAVSSAMTSAFMKTISKSFDLVALMSRILSKQSNFYQTLNTSILNSIVLLKISYRYISMALFSVYQTVLTRVPNKLLLVIIESNIQINRLISKILNITFVQVPILRTQASRFLSLSVLPSMTTVLSSSILKMLNIVSEFTSTLIKTISHALEPFLNLQVAIQEDIRKILNLSSSLLAALTKTVGKTLNPIFIPAIVLTTFSKLNRLLETTGEFAAAISRFSQIVITMAITSAFTAVRNFLVFITLSIPDYLDGGDESSLSSTIDGGNESSNTFTNIYDGNPEFFITEINVQSIFNAIKQQLEVATTLTINFLQQAIFIRSLDIIITNTVYLAKTLLALQSLAVSTTQTITFSTQSLFYKTLSALTTLTNNFVSITSRYISFAVVSSFTATFSNLVSKFIDATTTIATTIQRKISISISNTLSLVSLLFTQSSRFVNLNTLISFSSNLLTQSARFIALAVLPSLFTAVRLNVNKFLLGTVNLAVSIIRTFNQLIEATIFTTVSIIRNTLLILSATMSLVVLIIKSLQKNLDVTLIFLTVLNSFVSFYRLLSTSINVAVSFVLLTARWISISVLNAFQTANSLVPNKLLEATISLYLSIQRKISQIISYANTFVTTLFTQSSRFIALSILTLFSTNFAKAVNKFLSGTITVVLTMRRTITSRLNVTSVFVLNIQRFIATTLRITGNYAASIQRKASWFRTLMITGLLSPTLTRVTKFVRTLNTSTQLVSSIITLTQRWISLSVLSLFAGTQLVRKLLFRTVAATSSLVSNLSTLSQRYISLAIINFFNANFILNISKSIAASTTYVASTIKNITQNLRIFINSIPALFTQSSRFIMLNILNSFTTVLRTPLIKKLVASSLTATTQIVRRTSKYLVLALSFALSLRRLISVKIKLVQTMTVYFNRRITHTLALTFTASVRITRAITVGVLAVAASLGTAIIKRQGKLLAVTSEYIILIQNRALMFVQIAVMPLFETNYLKRIIFGLGAQFQANLNTFLPNIRKTITRTLEASFIARVRQNFAYRQKGTKFAVRKSEPGSEGHATPTMNQGGSSAKQVNKDNLGRSKITRGDTTPLE